MALPWHWGWSPQPSGTEPRCGAACAFPVGPPVGTADIQVHNDIWTTLMARKRRWAARHGFDREAGQDARPVDLEHAGGRIRWRKGGQFAPI